jgi:hypothetical protein
MHLNRELRKLLLNIEKKLKQGTIKTILRNKLHFDEAHKLNKPYALAQRLRVKVHNLMHEYDTPTENVKQANQQTNRSLKTSTLTSYRAFPRSPEAEYTILNIQYDSARRLHI